MKGYTLIGMLEHNKSNTIPFVIKYNQIQSNTIKYNPSIPHKTERKTECGETNPEKADRTRASHLDNIVGHQTKENT